MDETHSQLAVRRDGSIVRLVLDNPKARNGISVELAQVLGARIASEGASDEVRCVVIEGSGGHFCAGADLSGSAARMQGASDDEVLGYVRDGFHTIIRALWECPVPTLAKVRGACVGFGFDMALACDLRVCAEDAKLGQVFGRIGLVPDGGSSFIAPRLVGLGRALELALLAETFDGSQAAAWGLVNRAVPDAALDELAGDWARRLAAGPPIAQRLAKRNLRAGAAGADFGEALSREAAAQLECIRSRDMLRGVEAFFRKQPPNFEGD